MANEATAYGVRIEPVNASGNVWRAVQVRHLTPSENRGKHNLFVDVVDESGNRVFDKQLRIAWLASEGDTTADYTPLDKPDTTIEKGDGNVDLYYNQTVTAWIVGDGLPSDRVAGIHTRHGDEPGPNGENWNSLGHHSFYVKFQRQRGIVTEPEKPTEPPVEPPSGNLAAQVAKNTADIARMWARLQMLDGEL